MTDFLRTLQLLEANGVPLQYVDAKTLMYFLNTEHKSPEEVVAVVMRPAVKTRAL